jgi:excisionase family DNA binding protein
MEKRLLDVAIIAPDMKVLVSVDEAAQMLSIGRSLAWELVRRNELCSVKIGRTRRVVVASLREYVGRLIGQTM